MNKEILYTVRDSALSPGKKLNNNTPLPLMLQLTTHTPAKTFTRQLPAMYNNCVLMPAVKMDVNKEQTAACPLLPAATIRHILWANSPHISFIFPLGLWPQNSTEHLLIKVS